MVGSRRARRERGASAVEFGVMIPVILLVILEVMSWAYMFSFRQALSQAADEGARAAVGAPSATCPATATWTSSCSGQAAVTTAVRNALGNYKYGGTQLACGAAGLVCTVTGTSSCPVGHNCVSVTVTYPYRSQPLLGHLPTNVGPFNLVLPPDLSFTSIVQVS